MDIPLCTSFLSPGRGIHFCQITVIVCNGTVVIAQQRRTRGRSEEGGRVSHSFNHVQYVKDQPLNQCEPVVSLPQSSAMIAHNPSGALLYFNVICCSWGRETSRVIWRLDYIEGPAVLSWGSL